MKMSPSAPSVKSPRPRRRRRWLVLLAALLFAWTLPRPVQRDVVVEADRESPQVRLAFRSVQRLSEFSGKGTLAEETELSGPCFSDEGRTLYFSRSRPGQRADIQRTQFDGERWSKPEPVRELNSVDDDRRLTLTGDGRVAALASNRSGGRGGFDIYEATNDGRRWTRPRNAGPAINSEADEFDPALAPDGLTLYFVRVVPGQTADLFVARRAALDSEWSEPQPLTAVNLPDSHERSPAVSPDGQTLIFSSNRRHRADEPAPFALFQSTLSGDAVGVPQRLRDGIASLTDDVDASYSHDGQSLVFVSKRDGAKQIYLSRGEFVESRLAISTAHLEALGPAKWGAPVIAAMLLTLVWRWARRPVVATPAKVAPATGTQSLPPRRSDSPKNPLAQWSTTAPTVAAPPARAINPLREPMAIAPAPVEVPATPQPVAAPRRRTMLAVVVVAIAVLFATRSHLWDRLPISTEVNSATFSGLWSELVTFPDLAAPRAAEVGTLPRSDTARREAPQTSPSPADSVALRPAARWPTDRILVRQRFEVTRAAEADPTSRVGQTTAMAKRSPFVTMPTPIERPADAAVLTATSPLVESPTAIAPISTARQFFDPSAADRIAIRPTDMRQATLRPGALLAGSGAATNALAASVASTGNPSASLPRRGAISRPTPYSQLAEPTVLIEALAIASVEPPLPPRPVSLSRAAVDAVARPLEQLTATLAMLPPPMRRDALSLAGATPAVPLNASSVPLPLKSSASRSAIPLPDVPTTPSISPAAPESNPPAPTALPARSDRLPPAIAPTTRTEFATSIRADVAALRMPARIEPSASPPASLPATRLPNLESLPRRGSSVPSVATALPATNPEGADPSSPLILQASATLLMELLPVAPLTTWQRTEASMSGRMDLPIITSWWPRAFPLTVWRPELPTVEPGVRSRPTPLSRRTRELAPAELVEDVKSP